MNDVLWNHILELRGREPKEVEEERKQGDPAHLYAAVAGHVGEG